MSWKDEYEIKKEKMPEWFDTKVEAKKATTEEKSAIDKLLEEYRWEYEGTKSIIFFKNRNTRIKRWN